MPDPDPVIRLCHNPSCSKTFTYTPSAEAAAKGLLDVVDKMATRNFRFKRYEAPNEPGGRAYYCERCIRDLDLVQHDV